MSFFERCEEIFSDPKISSAFALFTPENKAILSWGESSASALAKLILHPFFSQKKAGCEFWGGFSSLSPQNSQISNEAQTKDAAWLKLPAPAFTENREDWNQLCEKIMIGIEEKHFEKIVPARFREATLTSDATSLLLKNIFARLCARTASNTFKFLIRAGDSYFFGATPELLFRRAGSALFVPAIAGTRHAEQDNLENRKRELSSSEKDLREHALVVEGIKKSLLQIGLSPESPANPEVRQYGSLLHLFTPIQASCPANISSADLVRALHPTPAIGGSPREAALEFLFQNESWDRGLFASPLLFSLENEELCLVAIRSALLRRNQLRFFAGAGFVRGSDAKGEWRETGDKMRALESVFFEGLGI